MGFKTLQDIIDYAIEREKEAAAFYGEVSEMEYASGTRQMFKDFAAEELKHQKLLEGIGQSVDSRCEIPVVVTYEDFHSWYGRKQS